MSELANNIIKNWIDQGDEHEELNLSNLKLKNLDFIPNSVKEIVVNLNCKWNNLEYIDLKPFTNLKVLNCSYNDLKSITDNSTLETLYCSDNKNLNFLPSFPELLVLECYSTSLESLPPYPHLKKINCNISLEHELNMNLYPNLKYINNENGSDEEDDGIEYNDDNEEYDEEYKEEDKKYDNKYETIELSNIDGAKAVIDLWLEKKNVNSPLTLHDLDLDNLDFITDEVRNKVTVLLCSRNNLKTIPLFPNLKGLHCIHNKITTLPSFLKIEAINCSNNKLQTIPYYSTLKGLVCDDNKLLTIPEYPKLTTLSINNNNLKFLPPLNNLIDLSCKGNPKLRSIPNMPLLQKLFKDDNTTYEGFNINEDTFVNNRHYIKQCIDKGEKSPILSEYTKNWLMKWIEGGFRLYPTLQVRKEMLKFKKCDNIKICRGIIVDESRGYIKEQFPLKINQIFRYFDDKLSSWSYSKEICEDFANKVQDKFSSTLYGIIIETEFKPEDIFIDLTLLPPEINTLDNEEEIIILPGTYTCKIVAMFKPKWDKYGNLI